MHPGASVLSLKTSVTHNPAEVESTWGSMLPVSRRQDSGKSNGKPCNRLVPQLPRITLPSKPLTFLVLRHHQRHRHIFIKRRADFAVHRSGDLCSPPCVASPVEWRTFYRGSCRRHGSTRRECPRKILPLVLVRYLLLWQKNSLDQVEDTTWVSVDTGRRLDDPESHEKSGD